MPFYFSTFSLHIIHLFSPVEQRGPISLNSLPIRFILGSSRGVKYEHTLTVWAYWLISEVQISGTPNLDHLLLIFLPIHYCYHQEWRKSTSQVENLSCIRRVCFWENWCNTASKSFSYRASVLSAMEAWSRRPGSGNMVSCRKTFEHQMVAAAHS